ncbi:MAG: prenyltransferase [Muribaculaceae bacterium]|nr:prenyltransferase [Muribaculaceae bacterium]
MNTLTKAIIKYTHPSSLILSVGAIMAGLTASVIRGGITFFPALMTLIFAILLQISGNIYHGYTYLNHAVAKNISGMGDPESKRGNLAVANLLKVVANAVVILAVTAGLALFSFVGWLGVAYLAVIIVILYFYLAGPHPIVRTPWSNIVTFLLFGPIAVSGTAIVQMPESSEWLPVIVYSVINGLMASNTHIAIQYLRYNEDRSNGFHSIVNEKGGSFARFIYLGNTVIVALILIIRPTAVEFVSHWVGIAVAAVLLVSSAWVFAHMHRDPAKVSRLIRSVTMDQYILLIIVLLAINLYALDDFHIYFFHLL